MGKSLQTVLDQIQQQLQKLQGGSYGPLGDKRKADVAQIEASIKSVKTMLLDIQHNLDPVKAAAESGHALRGALHGGMGHSTMLRAFPKMYEGEPLTPEQSHQLNALHTQLEDLLRMANQLVIYARLKLGTLPATETGTTNLTLVLDDLSLQYKLDPTLNGDNALTFWFSGEIRRVREAIEMVLLAMADLTGTHPQRIDRVADEAILHLRLHYDAAAHLLDNLTPLLHPDWLAGIISANAAHRNLNAAMMMLRTQKGDLAFNTRQGALVVSILLPGEAST